MRTGKRMLIHLLALGLALGLISGEGLIHGAAAPEDISPSNRHAPGIAIAGHSQLDEGSDPLDGGCAGASTDMNCDIAGGSASSGGYGAQFVARGRNGRGVYGAATNSEGDFNYGGYFVASGSGGRAVYGSADNWRAGRNHGGYFVASGAKGEGVYGQSNGASGIGVKGLSSGQNGQGVRGEASGNYGHGGSFIAYGGQGIGVQARGRAYAADFQGKVAIRSYGTGDLVIEMGEGLDYAEGFDIFDGTVPPPGSVLIIDPDHPGGLTLSSKPYDTRVAGIVAGARGLASGVRLGSGLYDLHVALAGRVYCYVDATGGSVEPGDLLTTSATAGYAMGVRDPARAQGAILGKAMEGLEEGEMGLILVLVTLQ